MHAYTFSYFDIHNGYACYSHGNTLPTPIAPWVHMSTEAAWFLYDTAFNRLLYSQVIGGVDYFQFPNHPTRILQTIPL